MWVQITDDSLQYIFFWFSGLTLTINFAVSGFFSQNVLFYDPCTSQWWKPHTWLPLWPAGLMFVLTLLAYLKNVQQSDPSGNHSSLSLRQTGLIRGWGQMWQEVLSALRPPASIDVHPLLLFHLNMMAVFSYRFTFERHLWCKSFVRFLPALRDDFHSLLPVHCDPCLKQLSHSLSKSSFSAICQDPLTIWSLSRHLEPNSGSWCKLSDCPQNLLEHWD